jgi:hypothetical protein
MADKLVLDVGLAVDLKAGFARNGWTEAQIKRLSQGTFLKSVLEALEGRAEIRPRAHGTIVDLDADPFIPAHWEFLAKDQLPNRAHGTIDLAKSRVGLYFAKAQKKGIIDGESLRADLLDKPVLGAVALDFYMKNPHLMEEWKRNRVFFWGAVYQGTFIREGIRDRCVRYVDWTGSEWICGFRRISAGEKWFSDEPAALASYSSNPPL